MRPVRHIRNIWWTIPGLRGTCESELRAGQRRCSWPKVHETKQIIQDVFEYSERDRVLFSSHIQVSMTGSLLRAEPPLLWGTLGNETLMVC